MPFRILVEGSDGKRSLGKIGSRREDNIRVHVREVRWEHVKWIHVAQWLAFVNTVMNFRVPYKAGNF
jgi:hypothetical protein